MNMLFWDEYEKETREFIRENIDVFENIKSPFFFIDGQLGESEVNSRDILFIMKEVHDETGCVGCECEGKCSYTNGKSIDFTRCIHGFSSCKGIWERVMDMARVISRCNGHNSYTQEELISSIAVINIKKMAGGGTAKSEKSIETVKYEKHAKKFQEKLIAQIREINPKVVVCLGTFERVRIAKLISLEKYKAKVCRSDYPIINVDKDNRFVVIDSYHPATPMFRNDESWHKYLMDFERNLNKFLAN